MFSYKSWLRSTGWKLIENYVFGKNMSRTNLYYVKDNLWIRMSCRYRYQYRYRDAGVEISKWSFQFQIAFRGSTYLLVFVLRGPRPQFIFTVPGSSIHIYRSWLIRIENNKSQRLHIMLISLFLLSNSFVTKVAMEQKGNLTLSWRWPLS